MRWIGTCNRAFDMMCERAVSRTVHGKPLGDKQFIQDFIAESATEIQAARLLTLHAAWHWDTYGGSKSRIQIAQIKYWGARVLYNVIDRAIQVHGALGYSADQPVTGWPSEHIPTRTTEAEMRFAAYLDLATANL
jgi:acyl-CoA dehydrogenase